MRVCHERPIKGDDVPRWRLLLGPRNIHQEKARVLYSSWSILELDVFCVWHKEREKVLGTSGVN